MIQDDKYIIFKMENWEAFRDSFPGRPPDGVVGDETNCHPSWLHLRRFALDCAIPDGVVIRHQDLFAAPAFYEYAGAIRTLLEGLDQIFSGAKVLHEDTQKHLEGLADYFQEQGDKASAVSKRKLPD